MQPPCFDSHEHLAASREKEEKEGKKKKGKEGRATASARTKPSSASPSCVYITRLCRRLKIGEKSDLSLSLWNRRCSAFRGALARFLNHSASSEGKNFSRNLGKRPVFSFSTKIQFSRCGEEGKKEKNWRRKLRGWWWLATKTSVTIDRNVYTRTPMAHSDASSSIDFEWLPSTFYYHRGSIFSPFIRFLFLPCCIPLPVTRYSATARSSMLSEVCNPFNTAKMMPPPSSPLSLKIGKQRLIRKIS